MNRVDTNLWLGSLHAANNTIGLKKAGITHVLTIISGFKPMNMDQFVNKKIEALDHPEASLVPFMDEAADFIKEGVASGGILVHCFAGISRSTTMVIAYLMKEFGKSVHEALYHIRKNRPFANPNHGFMNQLYMYERELKKRAENPP